MDFIKNNTNIGYNELKINDPNIDTIITKDNLFDSFENLYWYLTLKFNSTKKTSDFFNTEKIAFIDKSIDIEGKKIHYIQTGNPENATLFFPKA